MGDAAEIVNSSITFTNSVTLKNENIESIEGAIRFNNSDDIFKGKHLGSDIEGEVWRPISQNVASRSEYGIFKIGNNLSINSTGSLSSFAPENSRYLELIVTVSPFRGAADYTDIQTAIDDMIGTEAGGYTDGILTQPGGVVESAPSETYQFIILLAPGVYKIDTPIILAPFTTLRGINMRNSIIQYTQSSSDTIGNSSAVVMKTNCKVENLLLELNGNNKSTVVGIYSSGPLVELINVKNVNIINFGEETSSSNIYGVYLNDVDTFNIVGVKITFSNSYNNLFGIFLNNVVHPSIKKCKINIENLVGYSNNIYGFYIINSNSEDIGFINENHISVYGADNCHGIYVNNSSCHIKYNTVISNDKTNNSYGLTLYGNSKVLKSSNNILYFIHSEGQRDSIVSNSIGSVNFEILGFKSGQYIKVFGSNSNDGIYKIFSVVSSIIYLGDHETLSDEYIDTIDITITSAYYIGLEYNSIFGSTYDIYSFSSTGTGNDNAYYSLDSIMNNLESGNVNLNTDNIYFSKQNIIYVGSKNGDYKSLSNAINDIINSSQYNRYCVMVEPGIYVETNRSTLPEYVTIIGSGIDNTHIIFDIVGENFNETVSCIELNSYSSIRNIKIQNLTTGSGVGVAYSCVIYGKGADIINKLTDVYFENIKIISSGVSRTKYGCYLEYVSYNSKNLNIEVNGNNDSDINNYAICEKDSEGTQKYTKVVILDGNNSSKNVGYTVDNCNTEIYSSNIYVSGSNTLNIGIETLDETTYYNNLQIFNSIIKSKSGSGSSVPNTALQSIKHGNTNSTNYYIKLNNSLLEGNIINNSNNKLFVYDSYRENSDEVIIIGKGRSYLPISKFGKTDETSNGSLLIGKSVGNHNMTGKFNTLIGDNVNTFLTTGKHNTSFGSKIGNNIETGNENTLIGFNSGDNLSTNSDNNVIINQINNGSGIFTGMSDNVCIGKNTGIDFENNIVGNVLIGSNSGANIAIYNSGDTGTNVMVGNYSGYKTTNPIQNVIIGSNIGKVNLTSCVLTNTLIGGNVLKNSYSSLNNTIIGNYSHSNKASSYCSTNTILGNNAIFDGISIGYSTILGSDAGYRKVEMIGNTVIGNKAEYGSSTNTNNYNVVIGNEAGYEINDALYNVVIGSNSGDSGTDNDKAAGFSMVNGENNVILGTGSGKRMTSGYNNVLIGGNSGVGIISSSDNVLIGNYAGKKISSTTGRNIFIGSNTGGDITSSDNLIIGQYAGELNSATYNTLIGYESGYYVSGDRNIFLGYQSGGNKIVEKTGNDNLCIGYKTGYNMTSASNNVVIGSTSILSLEPRYTGGDLTTGSNNTIIGHLTGSRLTTQENNILIGNGNAKNLSGNNNLFIGDSIGIDTISDDNIAIGYQTYKNLLSGKKNLGIGYQAGLRNVDGDYNLNIGYSAGYSNRYGNYNINVGDESGYYSRGSDNIFMGTKAGYNNIDSYNNISIGKYAGFENNGRKNINLGTDSGKYNEFGDKNICIGLNSGKGKELYSANKNILIGTNSGKNNKGSQHIYIGTSDDDIISGSDINGKGVGYNSTILSHKNIYIGSNCGIENTDGKFNIGIGCGSMENNITGNDNIAFGFIAGQNIDSGIKNILIGYGTGINLNGGDNNIFIGSNSGSITNTEIVNNIAIGSDSGKYLQTNNFIGIGINSGEKNTSGENNIFIGTDAGKNITINNDNIFIGINNGIIYGLNNGIIYGLNNNNFDGDSYITLPHENLSTLFNGTSFSISFYASINTVGTSQAFFSSKYNNTNNQHLHLIRRSYGNITFAFWGNDLESIQVVEDSDIRHYTFTYNSITGDRAIYINQSLDTSDNSASSLTISPSFYGNTNIGYFDIGDEWKLDGSLYDLRIFDYSLNSSQVSNIFSLTPSIYYPLEENANSLPSNDDYNGTNNGVIFNTIESRNIFIGYNVGKNSTYGSENLCFGSNVFINGNGSNNILMGSDICNDNNGDDNIAMGTSALYNNETGDYNIVLGKNAGFNLNSDYKIFMGTNSGYTSVDDNHSIGIGNNVLRSLVDSDYNIGIGNGCLEKMESRSGGYVDGQGQNFALGTNALNNVTSSISNFALGTNAGEFYDVRTNNSLYEGDNLFIGTNSGRFIQGEDNCFIGKNVGRGGDYRYGVITFTSNKISFYRDTSNDYIFLSDTSGGDFVTSGLASSFRISIIGAANEENIFINKNEYTIDTDASSSQIITFNFRNQLVYEPEGNEIFLYYQNASSGHTAMGQNALKNIYGGTGNSVFGAYAGEIMTTGKDLNIAGSLSGANILTSPYSNYIGYGSGLGDTYGNSSTLIGKYSGTLYYDKVINYYKRCIRSIAIGNYTLGNLSGTFTLNPLSTSQYRYDRCCAIGHYASSNCGKSTTTGRLNKSTVIGNYAGHYLNGQVNLFIGYSSGYNALGEYNTYIGQFTGCNNVNGNRNIFLASGINSLTPDLSTSLDDTFSIYKSDSLNTSSSYNPLLFGELDTVKLTINSRSFISYGSVTETNTKLFVNGGVISNANLPFTGVHHVYYSDSLELQDGMILSSSIGGIVKKINIINTKITVNVSRIEKDKKVYGIYCGVETKDDGEVDYNVASVGEGCILITNIGGEVQNGDYISSSVIPGFGMKQDDDLQHSYTVAKCTEEIYWDLITDFIEHEGTQYKRYLCGCTYHCG